MRILPMTKQQLAEAWRTARTEANLTQEDIATALDIPRSGISAIETGDRDIGALELYAFSLVVKKPIEYFLPSGDYWTGKAFWALDKLKKIQQVLEEKED